MKKTPFISKPALLLIFISLISASFSWSQRSSELEGKTFVISVSSYDAEGKNVVTSFPDEISFVAGKIYSRKMAKDYNCSSDIFSIKADSSNKTNSLTFIGFTRNELGEIEVFWKGTVTGDAIQGTMHWFSKEVTNSFAGGLKYANKEK